MSAQVIWQWYKTAQDGPESSATAVTAAVRNWHTPLFVINKTMPAHGFDMYKSRQAID